MKRLFSLLLCCVMLATLPVGCKKKSAHSTDLTDTAIVSDLTENHSAYSFSHTNGNQKPTISDFKISNRTEKDGVITLSITAIATTPYATIDLAADMEYTWELNYWRMSKLEVTEAIPTVTAAPSLTSVKDELSNYVSIVGNALAIKDEEYHNLKFDLTKAAWSTSWTDGAQTAKVNVAYHSDALSFTGYYVLNFGENGWTVESEKQENGQMYPLLHLERLDQEKEEKK